MAGEWQETTRISSPDADRRAFGARVDLVAARQERLIRHGQLRRLGLSASAIRSRVRARTLHRLHPGVYALHPPPHSPRQRWLAAVWACGRGSLLSDLPAAHSLGIVEELPHDVHVSNPTGRGRSLRGIVVHRRSIAQRDSVACHGIPCTSATRTVVDLAAHLSVARLEDILLAADSKGLLHRARLEELLAERHGQPGTARLSALITDDPIEARNRNERRLFSICREFGVPLPLVNHRIVVDGRTFYADFCWPALRLIVEADSWRWHGGRQAAEGDADRDQLLSIAGWQVVHFTRDQIAHRRAQTGRRLVALTGSSPGVA